MPAVSKSQQRLMAIAYAVKKGDKSISDIDSEYRDRISSLVDSMTAKQLKDYAETSHNELPEHLGESGPVQLNPGMNVPGVGDVSMPADPGSLDSFSTQTPGSGDIPVGKAKRKKKRLMTFDEFILEKVGFLQGHTGPTATRVNNYLRHLVKKYEIWERGVIKAWGDILYLDYHALPKSGKTQSFEQLKRDFVEFFHTKSGTDEYDDLMEWLQEGGSRNGIPLFNKKIMDSILDSIAKKTPAPFDIIVYRTSIKEQPGVNSYTIYKDGYEHHGGVEKSYLIPKGTPIIFAGIDADPGEIIWNASSSQLKQYKIAA